MHHALTILLCLALAGCETAVTSPPPSGATTGSPGPSDTNLPGETGAPPASLGPPDPGGSTASVPLPEPQPAEPFAIGSALYDPALVSDAVVTLLDQMGVEIVTANGSVLRPGADHGAGLLSLTEAEVRGLMDMTRQDLDGASEDDMPGSITIADLYRGLSSSLPAGFSVDDFAAAYSQAYSEHPDAFVAQIMLGQPIEPETRLLQIHVWLLLIDGFMRPEGGSATRTAKLASYRMPGAVSRATAQASGALGVAAQYQPPLQSPMPGLTDQEWVDLLVLLPTLAYAVPFVLEGLAAVHEGHGGPGPLLRLTARVLEPSSIVNRRTGAVVLEAVQPGPGLFMTMKSFDEAVLNDHGTMLGSMNRPIEFDASGTVTSGYLTKPEEATRRNAELEETGTLYAEVDKLALLTAAFDLPPDIQGLLSCRCLVTGTRITLDGAFPIEWHEQEALFIHIENRYDFSIMVGGIATLHRDGIDKARGYLAFDPVDGTYRGTLDATSEGHAVGSAVLTLAGIAECNDQQNGTQALYVVGQPLSGNRLWLRFYPHRLPIGDSTLCQPMIHFRKGENRGAADLYLPFNDTRWTSPAGGYVVDIPADYTTVEHNDRTGIQPDLGVCSQWFTSVTRLDPNAPATAAPQPQPPSWQCRP